MFLLTCPIFSVRYLSLFYWAVLAKRKNTIQIIRMQKLKLDTDNKHKKKNGHVQLLVKKNKLSKIGISENILLFIFSFRVEKVSNVIYFYLSFL